MDNNYKLYNMILPTFLLFVFSPKLIAISLIGNFVIDSLLLLIVIRVVCKSIDFKMYIKNIFLVWILGFVADILGVLYMVVVYGALNPNYYENGNLWQSFLSGVYSAVNHSGAYSFWSVVFLVSGILVASVIIYLFDYCIFGINTNFTKKHRMWSALAFAVFTAPYTFLLPPNLFY